MLIQTQFDLYTNRTQFDLYTNETQIQIMYSIDLELYQKYKNQIQTHKIENTTHFGSNHVPSYNLTNPKFSVIQLTKAVISIEMLTNDSSSYSFNRIRPDS